MHHLLRLPLFFCGMILVPYLLLQIHVFGVVRIPASQICPPRCHGVIRGTTIPFIAFFAGLPSPLSLSLCPADDASTMSRRTSSWAVSCGGGVKDIWVSTTSSRQSMCGGPFGGYKFLSSGFHKGIGICQAGGGSCARLPPSNRRTSLDKSLAAKQAVGIVSHPQTSKLNKNETKIIGNEP